MARMLSSPPMAMVSPSEEEASLLPSRQMLSCSPMLLPSPSRHHVVIALPGSDHRRSPLVANDETKPKFAIQLAEVAGQKAAECTAIACCVPCGVAHLLYTAAVKLPAAVVSGKLCAARRKNRGIKGGRYLQRRVGPFGLGADGDDNFKNSGSRWVPLLEEDDWPANKEEPPAMVAVEREMSSFFSSAGFWRSNSEMDLYNDASPLSIETDDRIDESYQRDYKT